MTNLYEQIIILLRQFQYCKTEKSILDNFFSFEINCQLYIPIQFQNSYFFLTLPQHHKPD